MLKKVPEIDQPFAVYGEMFNACFINYEYGHTPQIAQGVLVNGLIDCRGQVTIEKDVFTGHDIMLLTSFHDYTKFGEERKLQGGFAPVHIKEGAWLASRCTILPGVTVGKHAVVAAGAVVTKDVPDYELWGGNPAVKIKEIPHG
jgi:acetyltransferase-like isoleucine patch superfamily enzyme